jgi:hypothetical protein
MHDALLRAEPSQLGIRRERAPESSGVARKLGERPADDEMFEGEDRGHTYFIAAADREGEPVALEVGGGTQDHVRGRVVRIRVHGIGAIAGAGRGKTQIDDIKVADDDVRK